MNFLKHYLLPLAMISSPCLAENTAAVNKEVNNQQASNQEGLQVTNKVKKQASLANEQVRDELRALLTKLDYFSAQFEQKVTDQEGQVIQTGQGNLVVSKPNLLHWQTKTPDESLIVSDGDTLWFFDPFVEQVSAYKVDTSVANTPVLLLSSNDESLWQNFTINKSSDNRYQIHSKDVNARITTLELTFEQQKNSLSKLSSLSMLDSTGQLSFIALSNVDITNKPEQALFQFSIPEGVYLDDQR